MSNSSAKLNLSENSLKVLEKRYLRKDEHGKPLETPEQLFHRVANNIAQADMFYGKSETDIEKTGKEFYNMITSLDFMPNSPTLMNAGRELQQLSACFVLPIYDSMESIFETLKSTALIHKSGGGTGFSFSNLRPSGSQVKSTSGIASGPISFLKVFDAATQAVKQGGTRRGANMGILRVDHPDVINFITCKESDTQITNFNISIALTAKFMQALETNSDYDLIDPHSQKPLKKTSAREVFDLIVKMSHKNGEPGIVFIDRINEANPTPALGDIESTNPCGEQPLLAYESCNLGSINLANFTAVKNGKAEVDWQKFGQVVKMAAHFLDNVIDMNKFPLQQIEERTKQTRKIGLGVMGWADMLIQLGIPYNSQEAIDLAQKIMAFLLDSARAASQELAKERGEFPAFSKSVYALNKLPKQRNATLTTIAPTGTISIIANSSSGVEPLFAISYFRNVMDNDKLVEVNPYFEKIAKEKGFYSPELMAKIADKGSVAEIDEVPADVKKIFVCAHDIAAEWHLKMQAAFQKFTDNAVSKTLNLPFEATLKDVEEIYISAYKLDCKGVTIYRDRSRDMQVLNIGSGAAPKQEESVHTVAIKITPRPRPSITKGTTTKIQTGCGNLYVTVNEDEQSRPFEIFMQMGKAGGCAASQLEAVGRLVSLCLRSGLDAKAIIEQLTGIRCPSPSWEKGGRIFSCADAIAKVLERQLIKAKQHKNSEPEELKNTEAFAEAQEYKEVVTVVGVCPDCGSALIHEEGCQVCRSCGFSKCG